MNSIKRIAIAALVICTASAMSAAMAAPGDTTGAAPPPPQIKRGINTLDLTPDQQAKIKEIREATKAQREAVEKDTTLTTEAKQAKLKEIRKSTEEQIRAVLTPEQQQKLRETNGKPPVQAPRAPELGSRIMEKLTLTEDQKAKIMVLREATKTQIEAVQKDDSLTPEAKQARLKEIRVSAEKQLYALLTPEQIKELREINNKPSVQAPRAPGQNREIMGELNLSEDQKAGIKSINQAAKSEIEAVRGDTSLTPDARESRMRSIRESAMKQIRALLTPEQLQKLDAARPGEKKNQKS
jgi:Spy/CpxP family protein refolding chaperone